MSDVKAPAKPKTQKPPVDVKIAPGCTIRIPRDVWGTDHNFKRGGLKDECIWDLGWPCEGEVYLAKMFNGQIKVTICESHLMGHRVIMSLHKAGYDIEKILDISHEERIDLVSGIELIPWSEI